MFEKVEVFKQRAPAGLQKTAPGTFWFPLTGVTLQVSEPPADIATAVSAGDFFLSHAPLVVD